MNLSRENQERAKGVALAATALVVGGAVVKYVSRSDRAKGYVYYMKDTGNAFVGALRESGLPAQISGKVREGENGSYFELDDTNITPDTIVEFEEIFIDRSE